MCVRYARVLVIHAQFLLLIVSVIPMKFSNNILFLDLKLNSHIGSPSTTSCERCYVSLFFLFSDSINGRSVTFLE